MPRATGRFTPKRLTAIAILFAVTITLVVVGDPFAHAEEGTQPSGERGVADVPRLAYLAGIAIAIAILLAMPPRREAGAEEPSDDA